MTLKYNFIKLYVLKIALYSNVGKKSLGLHWLKTPRVGSMGEAARRLGTELSKAPEWIDSSKLL